MSGRRKGKTALAMLKALYCAANGGKVNWVSGDTALAEKGWKELCDWLKNYFPQYLNRFAPAQAGFVSFLGGGYIERVTAAKATAGRGGTPNMIVVDEVQTVPHAYIKRAIYSMMTNGGIMMCMGTPPEDAKQYKECKWIQEMIESPEKFPEWLIDSSGTTPEDLAFIIQHSHPTLTGCDWEAALAEANRQLANALAINGQDDFDREIGGKWTIKKIGIVLSSYDYQRNRGECFDYSRNEGPIHLAIDRGEGVAPTVALFTQINATSPGIRVFDELYSDPIVDEYEFVQSCLDLCIKKGYPVPTLGVHDVRAPRYRYALFSKGVPPFSKNWSIDATIKSVNAGFRRGWIGIHPRCVRLLGNINKWKLNKQGEPSDYDCDGPDALRYDYNHSLDLYGEQWDALKPGEFQGESVYGAFDPSETVFAISLL